MAQHVHTQALIWLDTYLCLAEQGKVPGFFQVEKKKWGSAEQMGFKPNVKMEEQNIQINTCKTTTIGVTTGNTMWEKDRDVGIMSSVWQSHSASFFL